MDGKASYSVCHYRSGTALNCVGRLAWIHCGMSETKNKTGDVCAYNVTLRRDSATIVAVGNQYYFFWVCVGSMRYPACSAQRRIVICGLPGSAVSFFQHYLINFTIFGEKLLNMKCVFWFSLQRLPETLFILRRIGRDTVENVYWSACKVLFILVRF